MGHKLVQQPNGLWAIWSTIVDNFTWYDQTQVDAFKALIYDGWGIDEAWEAVHKFPERDHNQLLIDWQECIATIREIHGDEEADETIETHLKQQPAWYGEKVAVYREERTTGIP